MITAIECQQVWQEISNYIDGNVDAEVRARIEQHLSECRPCTTVLEGARNVIQLVGDARAFQVPVGFSQRLYDRVRAEIAEEQGCIHAQHANQEVPLGITDQNVQLGSHLVYFWENDEEFERGVRFIEAGLRARDLCIVQGHDEAIARSLRVLIAHGFDVYELMAKKRLMTVRREHAAQRTLTDLAAALDASVRAGAPAIRILGNLGFGRDPLPGGENDVVELEARVTEVIGRYPCVLICMYEVKTLPGRLMMKGGMENHPLTVCSDGLCENPHYREADAVLKQLKSIQ
jgi:MEDS: MEthanogen/methylotroph, DcmR Sensory domain/Putative zinc-finger